jgi:hypothetical protein
MHVFCICESETGKQVNACIWKNNLLFKITMERLILYYYVVLSNYPTSTRRYGNFAGVHTLLRILLSSNSAVLINIITGVSPPHFDFVMYYVLCQC